MKSEMNYEPLQNLIEQLKELEQEQKSKLGLLYNELADRIEKDTHKVFNQKGAYDNQPQWKARKITPRNKRMIHTSKLLQISGKLRDSIGLLHSNENSGTFSFGTDIPYAKYHQYGTSHIPQRKFLFLSKNTLQWLTKRLQEIYGDIL